MDGLRPAVQVGGTAHDGFSPNGAFLRVEPLQPSDGPTGASGCGKPSMSLVIFCLLFSSIDYVPVTGEIIWYLSLTSWLISLSIMLPSSIHAVA